MRVLAALILICTASCGSDEMGYKGPVGPNLQGPCLDYKPCIRRVVLADAGVVIQTPDAGDVVTVDASPPEVVIDASPPVIEADASPPVVEDAGTGHHCSDEDENNGHGNNCGHYDEGNPGDSGPF